MAKIIKIEEGFWVGKQMSNGNAFAVVKIYETIDAKDIMLVSKNMIIADIKKYLDVQIGANASDQTISILARQLCQVQHGMIYCVDYDARFTVRKILIN